MKNIFNLASKVFCYQPRGGGQDLLIVEVDFFKTFD